MVELNAYLTFDGNCAEAMRFYERVLGGKMEAFSTIGESPAASHVPPGNENRIMHARLAIDGGVLMASDDMPGNRHEGMKGFSLSLVYDTADEARRIFDALSEGGTVVMNFDKSFWSDGFGMLADRFGTPWMVNGGMAPS